MMDQEIAYLRLSSQRIAGDKLADPEEVVRWMGAVQAQEYRHALWAVGLRTASANLKDVERAIFDRRIVRTWAMRGTYHFIPAADVRWMLALCASRALQRSRGRLKQLGLDDEILLKARQILEAALGGGNVLTRPSIFALLEEKGIRTPNQRGFHILANLAQSGVLCLGPVQGKQPTFVLLEEWVPNPVELSRAEALGELARRYFTSHGPASVRDFAFWSGLTLADCRMGTELAGTALTRIEFKGDEYWSGSQASPADPASSAAAYLLPSFDEYLIGYKDRSAVLDENAEIEVFPFVNGVFRPVIVSDGQVAGTWTARAKRDALEISLKWFRAAQDAKEAAGRYSHFHAMPYSLVDLTREASG